MALILDGTNGETFPSWTTGTRPGSPATGQEGYNTTLGYLEVYTGSAWVQAQLPAATSPGQVLTANGTSWTSVAAAAGGFSNMQVFTSPGTFTTPSTTTKLKVTVVGGGGSGTTGSVGGAGGGGAAIYVGPVTASTPYAVTVGTGGTAPAVAGGTSSFAALASATGGAAGPVGAGGAGSAGTLQIPGGRGQPVYISSTNNASPGVNPGVSASGAGGNSILGIGGNPGGVNGNVYGGGGGGNAGNGAAGVVIVEY